MLAHTASRWDYGVALLLLAVLVGLCLTSIPYNSPTSDEQNHVSRGYHYLVTGNLDLNVAPPLVNALSGVPLLLREGMVLPLYDTTHRKTYINQFAEEFVWVYNDADTVINSGRLPIVLLSVVLGCYVFSWARELWGARAGLLALFLYVLDPNILAHSHLATTDLGLTCFIFISMYYLWRFWVRRKILDLSASGVAIGLALATKLSAPLLIPIAGIAAVIEAFVVRDTTLSVHLPWLARISPSPRVMRLCFLFVVLVLLSLFAFFTLWASYCFETAPLAARGSHATVDRLISRPALRQLTYRVVESIRIPFPTYFEGLGWLRRYAEKGTPAFLMGEHSTQGWWYYFLVAFALKTPLPTLVLVGLALLVTLRGHHVRAKRAYVLWIPVVAFFAVSFCSFLSIGYRHILPILPFLFVLASRAVLWLDRRWVKLALVSLGLWYAVGTIRIHPHYLAYFNEIAGGPDRGFEYLVDSNLDWGQDLKNLGVYMEESGLDSVYLAYFGSARPSYYGIEALPLPRERPEDLETRRPAVYAISATILQGGYLGDPEAFGWLRQYEPDVKIGYSIFLYRLP